MDSLFLTLLAVGSIWSIAVIVPGPNLFILIQYGLNGGLKSSLFIVLGIAFGTALWAVAGVLGITVLFKTAPWLYMVFKIIGGIYLLYLGAKLIILSYKKSPTVSKSVPKTPYQSFIMGLLTNISNPKTAMFVASLFASTLPANPSLNMAMLSIFIMVIISLSWYGMIALFITLQKFSYYYASFKKYIDRIAGGIFMGFGVTVITSK
jgi:threonine/homoserine/homoserine lactone efflux protein